MKIYFIHSTLFDYQTELYEVIYSSEIYQTYTIIFPHEIEGKLADSKDMIKQSDLIIAECSHASIGMGIELGWSSIMMKNILCLYKANTKPSTSLKLITSNIIEYSDTTDMLTQLVVWLEKYTQSIS